MTWTLISSTTFAGPVASVAAGQTLQNGWIDLSGNKWSINAANYATNVSQTDSAPWNTQVLIRPASEVALNSQIIADYVCPVAGSTNNNINFAFRHNGSNSSANCYQADMNSNGANLVVSLYPTTSGSLGSGTAGTPISGLVAGTTYTVTLSLIQLNSTTTQLTWAVNQTAANGGALMGSGTITDTTAALQNVKGRNAIFVYSSTNANQVARILTYNDILGVTSPGAKFSPGNWKGDTGRGGSVYRQSWNNGAWFSYTFAASASPTAVILLNSASASNLLSIYVNGILTDSVAASANVTLSGLVANATNTVLVVLRNSTQSARWNNGVNTVQVLGVQLDAASNAGVAPAAQPWCLIIGDSISEGIQANTGATDSEILDYTFHMMNALNSLGYDSGISACGYSGWLTVGDSTGDVPAYYFVSGSSGGTGGTYTDSSSRWNKIDNGVSLLDSNSKISSYGSVNTTPTAIFINYMTNEALTSKNSSDCQASVTQCIAALRGAAPNALIFLIVPFTLTAGTSSNYATYIAALTAGVAAYQAAHPSDTKVKIVNLGTTVAATLTAGIYSNSGGVHPTAAGHAYVAPMVTAQLVNALVAGTGTGSTIGGIVNSNNSILH